jgi:hypothetical protein
MRLQDLKENDRQLDEILPVIGAIGAGVARVGAGAAQAVGRGVMAGGQAVGRAVASGVQKGVQAVGAGIRQGGQAAGLAGGGMDPAQAAQAKKDHDEQKKQVQDAIKQKQAEISDLQKHLSSLG